MAPSRWTAGAVIFKSRGSPTRMEYTTLGDTGATVSRLALGCMSFGSEHEWMLDEEEGRELIERAIDLGITFFDTANVYSNGESEAILGDVLAAVRPRPVHRRHQGVRRDGRVEPELGAGSRGRRSNRSWRTASIGSGWTRSTCIRSTGGTTTRRSRRHAVRARRRRAAREGTVPRPLDVGPPVRRGAAHERPGGIRAVRHHAEPLQPRVPRGRARDGSPCQREGIGMLPWSPLGAGYLTRPYEQDDATTRGEHETALGRPYREGGGEEINRRIEELADEKDVKMAQIAPAGWPARKSSTRLSSAPPASSTSKTPSRRSTSISRTRTWSGRSRTRSASPVTSETLESPVTSEETEFRPRETLITLVTGPPDRTPVSP